VGFGSVSPWDRYPVPRVSPRSLARWPGRARALSRTRRLAAALLLALLFLGFETGLGGTGEEPSLAASPPLVGFSYVYAERPLDQARAGLRVLLTALQPDVVRLPVYWNEVQPEPGRIDFSTIDALLQEVADHNASILYERRARVILVVGVRNLAYPEVWVPGWLGAATPGVLSHVVRSAAYLAYLRAVVGRLAHRRFLLAWQVENEPFDDVAPGSDDVSLTTAAVEAETREVRRLDHNHPIVVTTYDSSTVALDRDGAGQWGWLRRLLPGPRPAGHPSLALAAGDVLGLDAYVVTPSTPLEDASALRRIEWKTGALAYWASRAQENDKDMWITEMQAAPWDGVDGFTPVALLHSARLYREVGATVVLLWGVERWLDDPGWMATGQAAIRVLRAD
jgi:hypothetical protein